MQIKSSDAALALLLKAGSGYGMPMLVALIIACVVQALVAYAFQQEGLVGTCAALLAPALSALSLPPPRPRGSQPSAP